MNTTGLYIHGEGVEATSGEPFPSVNPATDEVRWENSLAAIDHYTQREAVYVEAGDRDAPC